MYDHLLAQILSVCGIFVGSVGVLVILIGVVKAFRRYLISEWQTCNQFSTIDRVRYDLGTYLLLGLEFLIAADILETVVNPSLERIGILGGIVVIRTVLNFFLNKEMQHIRDALEESGHHKK